MTSFPITFDKLPALSPNTITDTCICVLGCLATPRGIAIKNEMLRWLNVHLNVVVCNQTPPGKLFEYPAIDLATRLSIKYDKPVLYIHTKGAGNPIPFNYKACMMGPTVNVPQTAKPEDCQRIVRLMWQAEFGTSKIQQYIDAINSKEPIVAAPYIDPSRVTWQNGWIMNSSAAKALLPTLYISNDRYYYEQVFRQIKTVKLTGIVINDTESWQEPHKVLWDSIWSYYNNTISNMV